jgi:hypothetical protein
VVLAVALALLGSCRIAPTVPPGCVCGAASTIARDSAYTAAVPNIGGGDTQVRLNFGSAAEFTFTRNGHSVVETFAVTTP